MYAKGTGRCVIIHIEFDSGELVMIRKEQLRLYAITDTSWLNGASLIDVVENVLKNGATFLQLREKNASHDEIVAKAKAIKPIARKYGVPFVIDDDVQAALEADADGVHIGQSDTDYTFSRFFSSIHGKGRKYASGKLGICLRNRIMNNTIILTPRATEVDIAAPSAPSAGIPNFPNIRE